MELSDVLRIIRTNYPEGQYRIASLRNELKSWYVKVKNITTGEEIKLEITKNTLKIESEEYMIEQFDDNDGKINIGEDGKIIDNSGYRDTDDDDAR